MMNRSLSEYFYSAEGPEGHKCGYCKGTDGSISHGMWSHKLTCLDYQDLLNRGWRRSGKYCYKPIMSKTCCPLYGIRCHVANFQPSCSHKSVLKKMKAYLVSGQGTDKQSVSPLSVSESRVVQAEPESKKKTVQPGAGVDPSKAPCRKAKVIRQERKEAKLASKQATVEDTQIDASSSKKTGLAEEARDIFKIGPDGRKPLEMFLELPESPTLHSPTSQSHKLEIKLIQSSPPSPEFEATFSTSYQLFRKYQMMVHQEKEEDCTEKGFRRFLCDSPLVPEAGPSEWSCGYGSYHQHYLVDGKLVAVGVIDILPTCISSVYVFYDVAYSFLSLGVYSALREIAMTRELYRHNSDFKYYCMGYYVHSCQKMRYKGQYTPSFLLCPDSYKFMPIETCLPKLDTSKYSRLRDASDEESPQEIPEGKSLFDPVIVLFKGSLFSYSALRSLLSDKYDDQVKEWVSLVGPDVAKRMIIVVS